MITEAQKQKILAAIAANRANYPSDAKHAASLGISTSVYSAIKNGQTDKALSDANWISIARRLGCGPPCRYGVEGCQDRHVRVYNRPAGVLPAVEPVGYPMRHSKHRKDFTARYYVQNHKNAVYIDCSQVRPS